MLSGPTFELSILARTAAPVNEASSTAQSIDTLVYEALPQPAGLRSRFFYIRRKGSTSSEYTLRFTYNDDSQETLTQVGTLVREVSIDNPIKLVEIIGSGDFEWILAGQPV